MFGLIVLLSTWWAFSKGAVIDLIATVVVVVAVVGGLMFATTVGDYFIAPTAAGSSPWSAPLGFIVVFVIVTIVGGLIRRMIDKSIEDSGLKPADRMIGLLLGFVRGLLIVLLVIACTLRWTGDSPALEASWTYQALNPFHADIGAFVDLLLGAETSEQTQT